MSAPQRWIDDPDADETLREVLRGTPRARSLDPLTRRRLSAKVARASAMPAVAAGWLFVKSAAAALGVVLGTGAVAVSTGVLSLSPGPQPSAAQPAPQVRPARPAAPANEPATVLADEPEARADEPQTKLNPAPSLPVVSASPSASGAGSLSAEAALLELARRQMRVAPSAALSLAAEHAARFPRGQLASERTLIQIEALHRLGLDAEARSLARGLLGGASAGLYAERLHQLLGENFGP
jgi:hypothetical protein